MNENDELARMEIRDFIDEGLKDVEIIRNKVIVRSSDSMGNKYC